MPQPAERRQVVDTAKAVAFHTRELLVTLIVLFVVGVIALTVRDALATKRKSSPSLPLAPESLLDNGVSLRMAEGIDSQGRQTLFEFLIWPRSVHWVGNDNPALATPARALQPASDPASLFGSDVIKKIASARTLLTLASVSDVTGKSTGEKVAARRAEIAARWLARIAPKNTAPIYELNLGRYHKPCGRCDSKQTTWRDAFVLVIERRKEFGAITGEALKNALSRHRNLPSSSRFSTFAAVRYKGVETSRR